MTNKESGNIYIRSCFSCGYVKNNASMEPDETCPACNRQLNSDSRFSSGNDALYRSSMASKRNEARKAGRVARSEQKQGRVSTLLKSVTAADLFLWLSVPLVALVIAIIFKSL